MKKLIVIFILVLICSVSYSRGDIFLNRNRVVMRPGEYVDLYADVYDYTGPVHWKSTDSHVASVNRGRVFANHYGRCFIKACISDCCAYCEIIVTDDYYYRDKSIKLSLNETNVVLNKGETFHLQLYVNDYPEDNDITYTTQNTRVATINGDGIITANGIGTTTIEVEYGGLRINCKVRVIMNRRKR